jgi:hypothetical protein
MACLAHTRQVFECDVDVNPLMALKDVLSYVVHVSMAPVIKIVAKQ